MLRSIFTYGPPLIFSLLRIPAYQEAQGMIWTDALIAGFLGLLGGYTYKLIKRKQLQKKQKEENL